MLVVDEMVGRYSSAFQFRPCARGGTASSRARTLRACSLLEIVREREAAIRTALGASTWQLRRMSLTESWLLSIAAGAVGLVVAFAIASSLARMLPSNLPRIETLGVGLPIVACAAAVSLVVGTRVDSLFHRLAWRIAASGHAPRRPANDRSWTKPPAQRAGDGRGALSLVLLVAAGLMGRGFVQLLRTDRGFSTRRASSHFTCPFRSRSTGTTRIRMTTFDRVIEQLRALPGVVQAATVTGYPGSSMGTLGGGPLPASDPGTPSTVTAIMRSVSPGYFATMQTRVLAGRAFSAEYIATAPRRWRS